jgi:hypothetical protein
LLVQEPEKLAPLHIASHMPLQLERWIHIKFWHLHLLRALLGKCVHDCDL